MQKFKLYRILLLIFLLPLIVGYAIDLVPVWIFWFLLLLFLSVLLAGIFFPRLSFFMPVISRGRRDLPYLLLSFDDGPDPVLTPRILKVLDDFNIKALFFCIGSKIKDNPELVREMIARGHVVGIHSTHHNWKFTFAGRMRVKSDLSATARLLEEITGLAPLLFRPPFGVTNPNIAGAVRDLGLLTIGWSVRSLDTVLAPRRVKARVLKRLSPGKVILFHDNRENLSDILTCLIRESQSRGYTFGIVEEVLGVKPYKNI